MKTETTTETIIRETVKYICDSCKTSHHNASSIEICPICGKEVCSECGTILVIPSMEETKDYYSSQKSWQEFEDEVILCTDCCPDSEDKMKKRLNKSRQKLGKDFDKLKRKFEKDLKILTNMYLKQMKPEK